MVPPPTDGDPEVVPHGGGHEPGESSVPGVLSVSLRDQLDTAMVTNTILAREVKCMNQVHNVAIQALLRCQGLLAQFLRIDVRGAFEDGQFDGIEHSSAILYSLDVVKNIVLPRPYTGGLMVPDENAAIEFVTKLLSRDSSEPLDARGDTLPHRQSFAAWRDFFNRLRSHRAWEVLDGVCQADSGDLRNHSQRPMGDDKVKNENGARNYHGSHSSPDPPQPATSSPIPSSGLFRKAGNAPLIKKKKRHEKHSHVQQHPEKPDKKRPVNQRERPATLHDSSSDSSSEDSSSSSPTDRRSSTRPRKDPRGDDSSIVELFRNFKFPKEVVAPSFFDPTLSASMKKFLSSFESYFDARYHGSDKEKSHQLGKFLKGSAKRAYDAIGGGQEKYKHLKPKLLDWYRSERTSLRQRKCGEFQRAAMLRDDTCKIYCLRLEKLAEQAFPDNCRERDRQMIRKFKETAPAALMTQIENAQGLVSAYSNTKVTWQVIKSFTETYDKQTRLRALRTNTLDVADDPDVAMYFGSRIPDQGVRSEQSPPRQYSAPAGGARTKVHQRTQVYRNRQNGRSPKKQGFSPTKGASNGTCNFCGRTGHLVATCWRRKGACFACGDMGHFSSTCPERQGNRQLVTCSECHGPHFGKDCPTMNKISIPSNELALNLEGAFQSRSTDVHHHQ